MTKRIGSKHFCTQLAGLALFSLMLFAVLAPVASAQVARTALISYRAGYTFELEQAKVSSGLIDLNGASFVEWVDVCDGYTLNQVTQSSYFYSQGGRADSAFTASTWEAKDGTNYQFIASHKINGEITNALEGHVELGAADEQAVAILKGARSGQEIALNSMTLFPTGYTQRLIDAAIAGQRMVKDYLFDGSETDLDHQFIAIAYLLPENEGTEDADLHPALKGVRSWPVRIAYFMDGAAGSVPDYEVGYDMYENGIATKLVLDYGDYTISGSMAKLEVIETPECD